MLGNFSNGMKGLQKNVIDDAVSDLIKRLPDGEKIDVDTLKKESSKFMINKFHTPFFKRYRIEVN